MSLFPTVAGLIVVCEHSCAPHVDLICAALVCLREKVRVVPCNPGAIRVGISGTNAIDILRSCPHVATRYFRSFDFGKPEWAVLVEHESLRCGEWHG